MLFGLFGKDDNAHLNNPVAVELQYGNETLRLETGRFAKQANGAVMATMGGTMVLATVCAEKNAVDGQDFFPLTVDYQEKFASAGRIPGSRDRREGKASTAETLTARLIDRPIRPLFPDTFKNKVQIIAQVFSYDKKNQPDVLAMIASSAALALSGIPFAGPIGAARVGFENGEYVLNPSRKEAGESEMDLMVAATKDGVLMVESEIGELDEKTTLGAVKFGFDAQQAVINAINELKEKAGKEAWAIPAKSEEYIAMEKDFEQYADEIESALGIKEKLERLDTLSAITAKAKVRAKEIYADLGGVESMAAEIIDGLTARIMRSNILAGKPRIDGRDNKTVRPIEIELGILPRAHGSALFTRGETQALVTLTLGGGKDALPIESMDGGAEMGWFLNYNFPGYSVGEAKMLRAPGRREIGHGNLAYRALNPMMPSRAEFDYVVRVVSDVLESNGSSSMATTCGGCLAMMDGGVPMKRPVAGIAMGLIKEGDDYAVLTDILGDEDHLGDMDFKVTGTKDGITATQMDIKVDGLSYEVLAKALAQAKEGRMHILGKIIETMAEPRADYKPHTPRIVQITIPKEFIGAVIGTGGKVIQEIQAVTGTTIVIEEVDSKGVVDIFAENRDSIEAALKWVNSIIEVPEVGKVYHGKVKSIVAFGAFIEILPGKEGLLHISEVDWKRLETLDGVLKDGDEVDVELLEVDQKTGKLRLSRKSLIEKPEGYVERAPRERGERSDRGGDRRHGGDRRDRRR